MSLCKIQQKLNHRIGNKKCRLNISSTCILHYNSVFYFFKLILKPKLKLMSPMYVGALEPISPGFEKNISLGSVEKNKNILSENIFLSYSNNKPTPILLFSQYLLWNACESVPFTSRSVPDSSNLK